MVNRIVDKSAKVLAAVGAINWGTSELLSFDVLSFVPAGMINTVAIIAIAASGAYVLWNVIQKKI